MATFWATFDNNWQTFHFIIWSHWTDVKLRFQLDLGDFKTYFENEQLFVTFPSSLCGNDIVGT